MNRLNYLRIRNGSGLGSALNNYYQTWDGITYLVLSDGTTTIRRGIREGYFVTDVTLTALGFDGTEDIDWENVESIEVYFLPDHFDDLLLDFDSRSGNTLVDSVSAETATILTPEFKVVNSGAYIYGDKTRTAEKLFDGNDYTIYWRMKQVAAVEDALIGIVNLGRGTASARGISFRYYFQRVFVYIGDGTANHINYPIWIVDTSVLPLDYVDVVIQINGTAKTLTCGIYNSSGTLINNDSGGNPVAITTRDISAFTFNNDNNSLPFQFVNTHTVETNFKKFSGLISLANCKDNTYVTGLQIHLPTIYGIADASGNGNHFIRYPNTKMDDRYYTSINAWYLDKGWTYWEDDSGGGESIIAPNDINGNYINLIPSGFVAYGGKRISNIVEGDLTNHNLVDSYIRFSNDFFDRSDDTIWNDACRTSAYYLSGNVKDFHISELNQRTLYGYLNTGYKGRLAVKVTPNSIEAVDRTLLTEVFLYTNDKTSTDHNKILTYTGDIIAAVLSGGNVVYDVDGYVTLGVRKTNTPMMVIRIDDGYDNCYEDWFPMLTGLGVKGLMNVHTNLVGTSSEGLDFMSWSRILEMHAAGWEVGSSGTLDNDWSSNTFDPFTLVEDELIEAHADLLAQGIPDNNINPNKHGIDSMYVRYLAKKHGYKSAHAGSAIDANNGTNPQELTYYNLMAIPLDIFTDYNVDDGTTEEKDAALVRIKAQLDLCVSGNRLAIPYWHEYGVAKAGYIQQVIEYAQANNIEILTLDEALENLSYQ